MAKKALNEMSFLDHLEALRWVLVRSSAAVLVMAVFSYFFADYIFNDLIFGPTDPGFITYRFFCDASHFLGFVDSICIEKLNFIIQNTEMEGQVNIFVWVCITIGFILAYPFILWELW